jgi:hypothetical protein
MKGLSPAQPGKYSSASDSENLTLEEICPIWSEKLRNGIDKQDRHILARDSKYCLVGEAWGFSGRQAGYYFVPLIPFVGCWTCISYGRKFGKIAKKNESTALDFEPLISDFVLHWNQNHKCITKARSNSKIKQHQLGKLI